MFTPAAIIVMSVTRSPLAPMLMAESESDPDPPSVVVGSSVVVSPSSEPGDEGVGSREGVGSIVELEELEEVADIVCEEVADVVCEVGAVVGMSPVGPAHRAQHASFVAYF